MQAQQQDGFLERMYNGTPGEPSREKKVLMNFHSWTRPGLR